jgi:uroporphyrinogen decarboxylase
MTHHERLFTAIAGQSPDRVPIALWRHFPDADQTAEGLAHATLSFQKEFDFDLVKVTPASGYMAEAWGAQLIPKQNDEGTRDYVRRVVQRERDWMNLQALDVTAGVLGRELRALSLIRRELPADTPVIQTIFSPLTTARNLAGERWLADLRGHPNELHAALELIARLTLEFALENLQAGAEGIFFATQLASYDYLSEGEYRTFGAAYDRLVLDRLARRAQLIILHIHGLNIMFDLLSAYPVQVIHWHDRRTAPSLGEGHRRFSGLVAGGLEEREILQKGSVAAVRAQVKDALAQTGGRRVMISAGCVVPINTPAENLRAACDAMREFS